MQRELQRTLIALAVASTLGGASTLASAAGFALIEQSASGMGNAFAGAAATAEDASTVFFNPAGMTLLPKREVVVAAHYIVPSFSFSDSGGSSGALLQTAGGNGGDAGSGAVVPNAYFTMAVTPQVWMGLGINVPFGLTTEYDPTWLGRFQAIKSEIKTVNINPSVAYQVSESFSVGAGLNYQKIDGELTSAANYSAAAFAVGGLPALGAIGGPNVEGLTTVKGDDTGWGYNVGALIKLNESSRIGLAYRSAISYELEGTVTFSNRPALLAAAAPDGPVTLKIKMPDSASVGVFTRLNDQWDILGDITWTGWSSFQKLEVIRSNGATLLAVDEKWRDTYRFGVGANYRLNEQVTLRGGIAYDQTPVRDEHRTARIPDNDRKWLTVGAKYLINSSMWVDAGYAHLFIKDAPISDNQAAAGKGNLVGSYNGSIDIFSVQYTVSF